MGALFILFSVQDYAVGFLGERPATGRVSQPVSKAGQWLPGSQLFYRDPGGVDPPSQQVPLLILFLQMCQRRRSTARSVAQVVWVEDTRLCPG